MPYPLWLRAISTRASPVNADLTAVLLPWASQIDTLKGGSGAVTPLFVTSRAGGVERATALLDPSRPFSRDSLHPRIVAALASLPPPPRAAPGPRGRVVVVGAPRSEEHTPQLQSPFNLLC